MGDGEFRDLDAYFYCTSSLAGHGKVGFERQAWRSGGDILRI